MWCRSAMFWRLHTLTNESAVSAKGNSPSAPGQHAQQLFLVELLLGLPLLH